MKLSEKSIKALGKVVSGDLEICPYRSGPKLVALFVEYGSNDIYGRGFPSRWQYAEEKIRELNDTDKLPKLIEEILDPREFLEENFDLVECVSYLNERFEFDGFQIQKEGKFFRLRNLEENRVPLSLEKKALTTGGFDEVSLHLKKAEERINREDFDGAITSARSMLETLLLEIERSICSEKKNYDGDINSLYKRVRREMKLEPSRADIDQTLKQILNGLNSVVAGLAGVRNKMGDAHGGSYKPAKHHAILAVDAAKTLCNFILNSKVHQKNLQDIKGA